MIYTLLIIAMHVLEVVFFIGLSGCVLVVLFSWISIFGSEFKRSE